MSGDLTFKDIRACDLCGSPVSGRTREGNALDFHRVVVERQFVDVTSVQQRAGLTIFFGGGALADALGSSDRASRLYESREYLLCNPCWYNGVDLAELAETDKGRVLVTPEQVLAEDGGAAPRPGR